VPDSDAAFLRYLGTLGLVSGARVEMVRVEPFRGPLTIAVDGTERTVGHELAGRVFAEHVEA
jgi:Fe2+ transport system protein FeoA